MNERNFAVSPCRFRTSQREIAYSTSNAVVFDVELEEFGEVLWL
jgi:hypothetical protein